ncbi:sigma 54-interacting transcriptional regulator [Methylomonas montana]|uniref:sigma-54 interaction domain-containing protein n=1 Tax=Methylomonas montana TaxID=3058963 RepID=UPI002659B321|nr:sigma 54-interacting transcriptional regulator [Methylomonas montana]WKJ92353.1 sigma 54-interacting transcriptional regulator [Methylomonas montana]
MSQSSPFFNRWLSQMGPDQVIAILTELVDSGAVFAVDAGGKVLFWSKGAEKLFGLPAESVLGKPCAQTLGCEEGQDPCGLAELGSIKAQIVKPKRANGERVSCYRTARAFFDAEGQFAGALEFLQPQASTETVIGKQGNSESFHGILSRDPAMLEAIKIIRNVAETEATVLIRGESGTGKELVARALHQESPRHQQPFLAINCAALSPSLLESELFGHVKGAFTGAVRTHAGLFQRAHGGTLFLDEVAELPLELQAKLLRVLQEQSFIPVGGDSAVSVDVRIIAATHRSLREEVKAGRFREDLMYRLRVVPVFLPPLRERRLDVNLLLWHHIDLHNLHGRRHVDSIAPEAMRRLLDYSWPGNVRELINVIEYAFAVGRGNELRTDDLPPEFRESKTIVASKQATSAKRKKYQNEADMIREALQMTDGNLEAAANYAGMSRATFWRKRKKYKIDP